MVSARPGAGLQRRFARRQGGGGTALAAPLAGRYGPCRARCAARM